MKGKKVPIKFQYFEVKYADDISKVYDLQNWIKKIVPLTLGQRIKEVNGIQGRVEKIDFCVGEYYALNFMRMEVISNTYIVQEDAEATHVDLNDDEYIGKNTVALYDPKYNVLMVQCNRGSYGVPAIENYINEFQPDSDKICLCPILNNIDGILRDNQKVMKIDVRFSDVRNLRADGKFFEGVVNTFEEAECLTAHIELGMGYDRKGEMSKETISAFICELKKNKKVVRSAKITLSEDQKSSFYDLLENIDHDILYFTCPERGELTFRQMIDRMVQQYDDKGSRARIKNLLQGA